MSSSSRTSNASKKQQQSASQWLEAREARLNPPMDDDEAVFDPFASLTDGDGGGDQALVAKLRLMFNWTPAKDQLH